MFDRFLPTNKKKLTFLYVCTVSKILGGSITPDPAFEKVKLE